MDERHEEFKGPRGWLLPSRRSLSWLIYLSEGEEVEVGNETKCDNSNAPWDAHLNGGMLRTFPQRCFRPSSDIGWENTADIGSHNGNLQVGWLLATPIDNSNEGDLRGNLFTHPVFLDCWYQQMNPYSGDMEPHSVLYVVYKSNVEGNDGHHINYITVPWMSDAVGGNTMEFLHHRALMESSPDHSSERLFVDPNYASQFRLLEDRDAWDQGNNPDGSVVEDILPKRGRLVVFDSVTLPHEVTPVMKGFRSALAGWFHEGTQPMGGSVVL
jgi:hypothetical protein